MKMSRCERLKMRAAVSETAVLSALAAQTESQRAGLNGIELCLAANAVRIRVLTPYPFYSLPTKFFSPAAR